MPLEPIEDQDLNLESKFIEEAPTTQKEFEAPSSKEVDSHRIEGMQERSASEKSVTYQNILSKVQDDKKSDGETEIKEDAKHVSDQMTAEAKVEKLVTLAMEKGIPHAVKVARHLEDYYSLDEFHDKLLSEELHQALIKKGMVKEI